MLPVSAIVPSVVEPDLNVTVPVGLPLVAIVAVNVTACPTTDGFRLDAIDVLLTYLLTACCKAADVLAVLFKSPTYLAIMERFP